MPYLPRPRPLPSLSGRWPRVRLPRRGWLSVVAGGLTGAAALGGAARLIAARRSSREPDETALAVRSLPAGATVEVDGRPRGRAPLRVGLAAGAHRVTLRHPGYAPAHYAVATAPGAAGALAAELWLATPRVERLRPPLPGARIETADFLRDGRVALTVAVPPGEERQVWLAGGRGGPRRVGPPEVAGRAAVAPDGERVAYLAGGLGRAGPTEVWLTGPGSGGARGERRVALPHGGDERLVDLTWAPAGGHLLLVSRRAVAGGQRTRLRRLEAAGGDAQELVTLPAEVVPGAYAWSPRGDLLALLTRAGGGAALSVLDTTDGAVRTLADLDVASTAVAPFPPVGWSPDGARLVYAVPEPERRAAGVWPLGTRPAPGLLVAELAEAAAGAAGEVSPPRPAGSDVGAFPVWRPDGVAAALARGKGGVLGLRAVEPDGAVRDVAALPLRAPGPFAAGWGADHARAIVAVAGAGPAGAGQPEFWLVRFRAAADEEAAP